MIDWALSTNSLTHSLTPSPQYILFCVCLNGELARLHYCCAFTWVSHLKKNIFHVCHHHYDLLASSLSPFVVCPV